MALKLKKERVREFTAGKADGTRLKLSVRLPHQKEIQYADAEQSAVFNRAIENGLPVKARIVRKIKENGLWSDEQQEEVEQLQRDLRAVEIEVRDLAKVRTALDPAEGVVDDRPAVKAVDTKQSDAAERRADLQEKLGMLREEFEQMTSQTADAKADAAHRNFLIACVIEQVEGDEAGKRLFAGVDEMLGCGDALLLQRLGYEFDACMFDVPSDWAKADEDHDKKVAADIALQQQKQDDLAGQTTLEEPVPEADLNEVKTAEGDGVVKTPIPAVIGKTAEATLTSDPLTHGSMAA